LQPFGVLRNFGFNFVTLFERFELLPLNGVVVDKYILATVDFDNPKKYNFHKLIGSLKWP
jgi:hypothetical protein